VQKRVYLCLAFVWVLVLALVTPAQADIQFSAVPDKTEYGKRDQIYLKFKLKNTGDDPVYVNKRFALGSPVSNTRAKEVFLKVLAPSGKELDCKHDYKAGYPRTTMFHELFPDRAIHSDGRQNIKNYYAFDEAGTYKVTAYYHNAYGSEIGIDTFTRKITSEPVEFSIVE